jgi:dipeptidyl aminopeptidase/acylaminoacyl peptidase
MARIRGPIGVAALALALLCGCGHRHSATGANWVVFASDRDGRWDVYAVHPNGTGLIRVTARREEMPPLLASSPKGDKLALVNSAGTTVFDASGTRTTRRGGDMYATPYVSEKGEVALAQREETSVSPDGNERAFLDTRGRLWIGPNKTAVRAHEVALAERSSQVVWSPDSSLLAFTTPRRAHAQLAVVSPDGSGFRVLTRSVQGDAVYPAAWTPDGLHVLAVRGNHTGAGPALLDQVSSIGADGRSALALTRAYPDGGENLRPVFFHGKLAATAAPPAVQRTTRAGSRTVLRTRYLVGEVRLRGTQVALLPLPHSPQTPRPTFPFLVWTTNSGKTES